MADRFAQLGDTGWASEVAAPVNFPIEAIDTSFEHDQGQHKDSSVDAIVPRPSERWHASFETAASRAETRRTGCAGRPPHGYPPVVCKHR